MMVYLRSFTASAPSAREERPARRRATRTPSAQLPLVHERSPVSKKTDIAPLATWACPSARERDLGRGGSFFASEGRDVGAMWRAFCRALEAGCPGEPEAIRAAESAVRTFASFNGWLAAAPTL